MNREEEERRYLKEMGRDAFERQSQAAKTRCKICWQPLDSHSPQCPKYRRSLQERQNPRRR